MELASKSEELEALQSAMEAKARELADRQTDLSELLEKLVQAKQEHTQ